MKGVGIVENLELLYSLTADDGESVKDLKNTIEKLQKIFCLNLVSMNLLNHTGKLF